MRPVGAEALRTRSGATAELVRAAISGYEGEKARV